MTAKKDAETKTTVRVNGGEEMPLDDLTPEKLADELGWTKKPDQEQLDIPETPEEKAARIRTSLQENVTVAQEAVRKLQGKLSEAFVSRKVAESILLAFDELVATIGTAAAVERVSGEEQT